MKTCSGDLLTYLLPIMPVWHIGQHLVVTDYHKVQNDAASMLLLEFTAWYLAFATFRTQLFKNKFQGFLLLQSYMYV